MEGVAEDEDDDEDGVCREGWEKGLLDCEVEEEKIFDGRDFRQDDEVWMLRMQDELESCRARRHGIRGGIAVRVDRVSRTKIKKFGDRQNV